MSYTKSLQKFLSSQYLYTGVRITLAVVIPSILMAQQGVIKDYFLFPLGTMFLGFTDQAGPLIRRRNTLLLSTICFLFVILIGSLLQDYYPLHYLELLIFGIFFSMIAVFGQRIAAVGGLTLVVFSIFIDGNLAKTPLNQNLLAFGGGCIWYILVYLTMSKLQPYKLAGQLIGENYLKLAEYLRIKSQQYKPNANHDELLTSILAKQISIKNLQEETREVVFKTRTLVQESNTTSRILMLMFLNSIDLYEKLITSDQDYQKINENFGDSNILSLIHDYLQEVADELESLGIALQRGISLSKKEIGQEQLQYLFTQYFELRKKELNPNTLEDFLSLRLVLTRIKELSDTVHTILLAYTQDKTYIASLSAGLDVEKFIPYQERFNLKVIYQSISFKSAVFRHAVRVTIALLIGYAVAQQSFLGLGHSYWILITIVAIMRPAYSTTKQRNKLRIYGTLMGALVAYLSLTYIHDPNVLFAILLVSMVLCFAFFKSHYDWSVFFMTIYILITFNFLHPGNIDQLFMDRIIDTIVAALIVALVSYSVLPMWEKSQNSVLMLKSLDANSNYLKAVLQHLRSNEVGIEFYKLKRKDAIISLANLSDNFQRMLSDPKNQQENLETLNQFVNTSQMITAYTASLSQYSQKADAYKEIDFENWENKLNYELEKIQAILSNKPLPEKSIDDPNDQVDDLIENRKSELQEDQFYDYRDPNAVNKLTLIKNMKEILELLLDVILQQRKIVSTFIDQQVKNSPQDKG